MTTVLQEERESTECCGVWRADAQAVKEFTKDRMKIEKAFNRCASIDNSGPPDKRCLCELCKPLRSFIMADYIRCQRVTRRVIGLCTSLSLVDVEIIGKVKVGKG